MKRLLIIAGVLSAGFLAAIYAWSNKTPTMSPTVFSMQEAGPVPQEASIQGDRLAALERFVRENPDDYKARYALASAYVIQGETDLAIQELEAAVALKPDVWEGHYNLGIGYYDLGAYEQATAHYKHALKLNPEEPEIHFNLALAYASMDRNKLALTEYEETIRINPQHIAAHNNLGNLYRSFGHPDLAVQEYQKVLDLGPDDIHANYNLAVTMDLMGKGPEGAPYYEAVVRLAGQAENNPEYQYYAEQAQRRLGQSTGP